MSKPSYTFSIDKAIECLFVRFYGEVDLEFLQELAISARSHEDYENHYNIIYNISGCAFEISTDDVRLIAEYVNANWPTDKVIKTVFLVDTALAQGMVRMFDGFNSDRAEEIKLISTDTEDKKSQILNFLDINNDYEFPSFLELDTIKKLEA